MVHTKQESTKADPRSTKKTAAAKKTSSNAKKTTVKEKTVSRRPKKAASHKKARGSAKSPATVTPEAKLTAATEIRRGFPIVGIGASAGGLETLETFFKAMPVDAGIGFVVVVHLDPTHISILPELLQKHTKMPVCQIGDGMPVERDHVYVIPPNKDLTILHGTLHLMDLVQPRGAKLPIDSFFRSLARDQERNAVCIILSGTGTDGTLGVKAIKGEVGMVMVQDEQSAKYDGMPRSAIATGLVDYVLPPEKMPEQLIKYTRHATQKAAPRIAPAEGPIPQALQKIFVILRARTEHDFTLYKKNTICRRVERRMNVHQIDDISDYVRYLQESDREAGILFKELLIGVTNFFRDPEAFETLRDEDLAEAACGKTGRLCGPRLGPRLRERRGGLFGGHRAARVYGADRPPLPCADLWNRHRRGRHRRGPRRPLPREHHGRRGTGAHQTLFHQRGGRPVPGEEVDS